MASVFTRIIKGEIPCYKIAENENYFAFLDINPLTKGHTLVVPKNETDYIFDIEDDLLGGLMLFSKKIAKAIDKATPYKRVGISVIGLEVPHAHIHLIPFDKMSELNFSNPKMKLSKEEFEEIAEAIKKELAF
jgi:histidine triad (HIT) family protein